MPLRTAARRQKQVWSATPKEQALCLLTLLRRLAQPLPARHERKRSPLAVLTQLADEHQVLLSDSLPLCVRCCHRTLDHVLSTQGLAKSE